MKNFHIWLGFAMVLAFGWLLGITTPRPTDPENVTKIKYVCNEVAPENYSHAAWLYSVCVETCQSWSPCVEQCGNDVKKLFCKTQKYVVRRTLSWRMGTYDVYTPCELALNPEDKKYCSGEK